MYSIRAQGSVLSGRSREFEALAGRFLDMLRSQPGCQGVGLFNSLSYPFQYNWISTWENRQVSDAVIRSETFEEFMRENTPATPFVTPLGPVEAYELVTYKRQPGGAGVAYLAIRTINPTQVDAFQQSRQQLFEILNQQRGVVTTALSRLAGSRTQWAIYLSWLSEDDMQAAVNSPELQQWAAQHLTAYDVGPAQEQAYRVVLAHVPTPA